MSFLPANKRMRWLLCTSNDSVNGLLSSTLGARGFSGAVSGFGQILKSDPRGFAARVFDQPSTEHLSACGRRNEAPRRTREKTSGTQGNWAGVRNAGFDFNSILEQKNEF